MDGLLGLLMGLVPLVVAFGLAATAAFLLPLGALVFPRLLLAALLAVTVVFPNSASAAFGGGYGFNAYGKGGQIFFFSIYELCLLALLLAVPAHGRLQSGRHSQTTGMQGGNPYLPAFLALALMHAGYLLWQAHASKLPLLAELGRSGTINMLYQAALMFSVPMLFADTAQRDRVFKLLALLLGGVLLWGAVRYVFLGGDPQGIYESESGGQLKLTFWDINFTLLGAMLASWLIWHAAALDPVDVKKRWKLLAAAAFVLGVLALSGRRSGQLGLALTLASVYLLLPKGRRWLVLALVALALPLAAYKLNSRISDDRPLIQKLIKGDEKNRFLVDLRYERSYELTLAWEDVKRQPWFGLGPSGSFNPRGGQGLEYHKGNYGFIHSGVGHVLMKLGFVGLALYLWLYVAYLKMCWMRWRVTADQPCERGYIVASLGGMACAIPNLLYGTPLIEIRSMVMMGVIMALPLLVRVPVPVPEGRGSPAGRSLFPGRRLS